MSVYLPPIRYPSEFNPVVFTYGDSTLTLNDIDGTYAKLAGNETIVGSETFSGGIKTGSLQPISSNIDVSSTSTGTTVTPLRILTPNQTGTDATQMILGVDDSATKSAYIQYVPNGFSAANSYMNLGLNGSNPAITLRNGRVGINNVTNPGATLHVSGNFICTQVVSNQISLNSTSGPQIIGKNWYSAATSHTISSTDLPILASTTSYWQGKLCVFANNGAGAIGIFEAYVTKLAASATPAINATPIFKSAGTFTTFTLTAAATSITVALSTSAKISWLFTGSQYA